MNYKRIISWVIVVLLAVVTNKLMSNKAEMKEDAKMANITSDVIPVEIGVSAEAFLNDEVKGNAKLLAVDELMVLSETKGKVLKVYKEEGDRVAKNEVLVQVEDEVFYAQYKLAKANYEKAQKDLKRFENLAEQNAIAEEQVEKMKVNLSNAEANFVGARKQYENTKIKSPISGTVNVKFAKEGMLLNGGTKIAEVVNVNSFELNVRCSEADVLKIANGQKVEVSIPVLPGEVFEGKVKSIAVKADASMKYNVELVMENSLPNKLKAGMLAEIVFPIEEDEKVIVINRKALVGSIKDAKVFVVKNNKSELRKIELGRIIKDKVEVKSGLKAGEKLVLSGQINLKSGTKVRKL